MSSHNSESGRTTPDEYEAFELATLAALPSLPPELQERIFECCCTSSLGVLAQLNKHWNMKTTHLLWKDIDFVVGWSDEDPSERTRQFFVVCHDLIENQPERWITLAQFVRTLNLGRLHGINLVQEPSDQDYDFFADGAENDVFEIIAGFANLENLSLYIKNWWFDDVDQATLSALAVGLTKLKALKCGGQLPYNLLEALFSHAENMEHLSLFNLHCSPGQDNGPEGFALDSKIHARLTHLKTLHLCKLADLDGSMPQRERITYPDDEDGEEVEYEFVSGMRWGFPRESEVAVLADWADILRRCSKTLEEVTLENRYLCSYGFDNSVKINPGVEHPAEYGAFSIQESHKALFPVLSSEDWPKLKKLSVVGMGKEEDAKRAVCHLEGKVEIEFRLAGTEDMGGDVTPEQISTPIEFYD